ncbi:lysozyme inhibitor LprI family protein [Rhizobium sullae]|uniref:DUF1311 domain-containing protein n=1 Tax=Rhizobium sullae TaxID=50338 RepID=A0A2N0D5P0_RHISU|nr:lysozyme inhibitor LprI family protein [Rhizobium sullae]PKA41415.1 DUF1311 domain-containing protein [Rhizobium sullae]UWU13050.1 lysozyme inhibitor LprI family protein [Rhizobium sullae]
MRLTMYLAGAAACLMMAGITQAQEPDCKTPKTQFDMTFCEQSRYETADAALNEQWKKARAAVAATDKDLDEKDRGAEKALLTAQRAWISYRDAQCEAFGFQARGGTMEPMLVAGCLANLTDERTKQLKELSDAMGLR